MLTHYISNLQDRNIHFLMKVGDGVEYIKLHVKIISLLITQRIAYLISISKCSLKNVTSFVVGEHRETL